MGSERTEGVVERLRELAAELERDDNLSWMTVDAAISLLAEKDARIGELDGRADKFLWQVRDTCARAERAEFLLALMSECADDNLHKYASLKQDYQDACTHLNARALAAEARNAELEAANERLARLGRAVEREWDEALASLPHN